MKFDWTARKSRLTLIKVNLPVLLNKAQWWSLLKGMTQQGEIEHTSETGAEGGKEKKVSCNNPRL